MGQFQSKLWLKIKKLCVVRDYTIMESLLVTTLEVEKVQGELRETPYEPLKQKQKKFMNGEDLVVEKQT